MRHHPRRRYWLWSALGILAVAAAVAAWFADPLPPQLATVDAASAAAAAADAEDDGLALPVATAPGNAAEVERLSARLVRAVRTAQPAVVAVRHTRMPSAASGVIITPDGLVLSQRHVTHAVRDGTNDDPDANHPAGTPTVVILHDGTECPAELLGASRAADVSLLRILQPGPFPFAALDPSNRARVGDFVVKVGHPGHYRPGRPSSVRLGRVLCANRDGFVSDCLINGGDSGGPYFDLDGRLVAMVYGTTADTAALYADDPFFAARCSPYLTMATSLSRVDMLLDALKNGVVDPRSGPANDRRLLATRRRLPADQWMQGASTRAGYDEAAAGTRGMTVTLLNGSVGVALGTVVEVDGGVALVVTKASEVPTGARCRLADGTIVDARRVAEEAATDLALLQIRGATGLKAVAWEDAAAVRAGPPPAGNFVAAVDADAKPIAVGIVSVPRFTGTASAPPPDPATVPARLPAQAPMLIGEPAADGKGFLVGKILDGVAIAAGLQPGDVIRTAGGGAVAGFEDLVRCVAGRAAGERVVLQVDRDGRLIDIEMPLAIGHDRRGSNFRADHFPIVFEIDAPLFPHECGGPVINPAGRVAGVAVARFALEGCRVIPPDEVRRVVAKLRPGR